MSNDSYCKIDQCDCTNTGWQHKVIVTMMKSMLRSSLLSTAAKTEEPIGQFYLFGRYLYVRQAADNAKFRDLLSLIQSLNYLSPLDHMFGPYHVYDCVIDKRGLLKVYKSVCEMSSNGYWRRRPYRHPLLAHVEYLHLCHGKPLNLDLETLRKAWAHYFQNVWLDNYIVIYPDSAEARLLETILSYYQDDKLNKAEVCMTSDMHSYLRFSARQSGKIALSGMKVRDGYVTASNSSCKSVYHYQDGLADGPYYHYSACSNCYGHCLNGRKYGKEYTYLNYDRRSAIPMPLWGQLCAIRDHDLNYTVNNYNNDIRISLPAEVDFNHDNGYVITSHRRDYFLTRPDDDFGCCQYGFGNSRSGSSGSNVGDSDWSINDRTSDRSQTAHVDIVKRGEVVSSFDFDRQHLRLLGPAQPLSWLDCLYYVVKWLCPSILFPDY